jgi:hypothetical protein
MHCQCQVMVFEVISKEQAKNYEAKNCKKNYQRMYIKYPFIIISLQKNIHIVTSNVKPTFFQDRLLSFPTNVPKKIEYIRNIFVFETKFIIKPKRSLSDFKILGPKALSFFSFKIFFETSKRSVLVLEICELNQNVLVLFLSFWIK